MRKELIEYLKVEKEWATPVWLSPTPSSHMPLDKITKQPAGALGPLGEYHSLGVRSNSPRTHCPCFRATPHRHHSTILE